MEKLILFLVFLDVLENFLKLKCLPPQSIQAVKLNSTVLPSSKGYILQYTPYGEYKLIVNEINHGIISIIILKNSKLPHSPLASSGYAMQPPSLQN